MLPTDPNLVRKRHRDNKNALWIGMGVAIGAAIGVITDNLAVWIAIGAAVGLALTFVIRRR